MNKKMLRIATVGAVTSVAVSGMAFAAAAPASAAPVKGKITISAPASVNAGSEFVINCKAKRMLRGQSIWLKNLADFGTSREVARNGNCRVRAFTNIPGTQKFFMKIRKNGKVFRSNVLTIRVD